MVNDWLLQHMAQHRVCCTFITAIGWPKLQGWSQELFVWHIEASLWYTLHLPLAQRKAAWPSLGRFGKVLTSDILPRISVMGGEQAAEAESYLRKNQLIKNYHRFRSKLDKAGKDALDSIYTGSGFLEFESTIHINHHQSTFVRWLL